MKPRRGVLVLVVLLSLPAAGCGFLFSHGPPAGHENMDYFSCTESNAGPIFDIIWASLNVVGAGATLVAPDDVDNPEAVVASGLAWGIFSSFAASTGFRKSSACRDAKRLLAERQQMGRGMTPATAPSGIQAVTITPSAATLAVGERLQLTARAHAANGELLATTTFAWSSSNDAIAAVSNSGEVRAYAPGNVVIAANSNNLVGTTSITVVPPR